jgi:putative MATE family efflux protein
VPGETTAGTVGHTSDREIARLSAIAFLTLVTEPLFLLADSAIIGHLGTPELAGLSVAAAIIGTVLSLCIFLAYGTTASVARLIGAGNARSAFAQGVDGLWLAVLVGGLVTVVGVPLSGPLVALFGPSPEVADHATTYLRISLLGTIPMLVVLAAVGVLRGTRDLRTPLRVAVIANLANIALNYLLVYPLDLGVAGSAIGTVIAQTGSAVALVAVVVRHALSAGAPLTPDVAGIVRAARVGVPLIVRTLMLRVALLIMTYAAAVFGAVDLATMPLALSIWSFLAFALDALGITAQTLVGNELGRGDVARARAMTNRLLSWGLWLGVATGLVLLACSTVLGPLFTDDPDVRALLTPVLLVAAVAQPVAGVVFTLDGILIGAGDGRFLAWAQTAVLAVFAPLAWLAVSGPASLVWLWAAFAVGFMGTRCVLLMVRARGDAWMTLGAG